MHLLSVVTVLLVVSLVGVEFSVSAFVNPAILGLEAASQKKILGDLAGVLGGVMPFWYAVCLLLLVAETWLHWHLAGFAWIAGASSIWLLTVVATIVFLVPLNNRVAEGTADWREIHQTWDARHRVRVLALAVAAVLLLVVVIC